MKIFLSILLLFSLPHQSIWLTDFNEAKQLAKEKHEFIILNFSGSDWCGPCIRMHKEIFENDIFQEYADKHLILVNADFPRLKKNQLPQEQKRQNENLADQYNKNGIFPYTLLLDADGKVLKAWGGFFDPGAKTFTEEIKSMLYDKTE